MTHPNRPSRGLKTICILYSPLEYEQVGDDPVKSRALLDRHIQDTPELFPPQIQRGYRTEDVYSSRETSCKLRRIELRDLDRHPVRPSFLMPYRAGRTADVQAPLFSASSLSPCRALAEVFGRDAMYWHRPGRSPGRFSLVGTTVGSVEKLPRHLVADEKHTTSGGERVYLTATAGSGFCLGLAQSASNDDLEAAYGTLREEARRLDPA